MSDTHEVPITFGEVPTVRTATELQLAAGKLMTAHHACVLDLGAACLDVYGSAGEQDPVYFAVRRALERENPAMRWRGGGKHDITGPSNDVGLHYDPMLPGMYAVAVHRSKPGGVFEATFALPTCEYDPDKRESYLTELLRAGMTNNRYADPESFRRASFSDGGTVAFSFIYPGALPQLHDFRTLSARRDSYVQILEAFV